eukprot:scaffold786_cov37-Cyclotella_meneghiniana.AAC.2
MRTPPAPPYATLFYAIHENEMLKKWSERVPFYKRFIDDVFGIWLTHNDPSQDEILWRTWLIFGQVLRIRRLCSHRRDADEKILEFFHLLLARGHTQEALGPLFDKAEANAQAYMQLSQEEREHVRQQKSLDAHNQVFLHLQYHPNDPQSRDIQRIWREQVLQPEGETLSQIWRMSLGTG